MLARDANVATHKTAALAGAALVLASAACSSGPGAQSCTRDDQCASHFCRADDTCAPAVDAAAGPDGPIGGPDAPVTGCTPNHDGTITRAEMPLAAGQSATFRIAASSNGVTVDTAGALQTDGTRVWSLSAAIAGDADQTVALQSPAGQWWAPDFPGASYATLLSSTQTLLGVFAVDDNGLHLLGIVSPTGGTTKTELTYATPVDVLRFPLTTTSSWSSSPTVTGTASGVPAAYAESYTDKVDAVGTMATPYGTFPVVRVAVDFTQNAGVVTTHKTYAFVAECYGTVATITSENYETSADFTKAAEVWRLAP
jgi:hypothetical protein